MRFENALDEVFGRRSAVALIRLLVRTRGQHTGRQLARITKMDHKTCHAALKGLEQQGIVASRWFGSAKVFSLREDRAVVKKIILPAFDAERTLVEDYVDEVRRALKEPPLSIVLFGSVARKEEKPSSDVDLLFVFRDEASARAGRRRTTDTALQLIRRYGNTPQIFAWSARKFARGFYQRKPLFTEIYNTGRALRGKSLGAVLRHVREEDRRAKRAQG